MSTINVEALDRRLAMQYQAQTIGLLSRQIHDFIRFNQQEDIISRCDEVIFLAKAIRKLA